MRITVDIPDAKIEAVLRATRTAKKSPAIAQVVDEYLAMKAREEFAGMIREKSIPYNLTNEEIEKADLEREKRLSRRRG